MDDFNRVGDTIDSVGISIKSRMVLCLLAGIIISPVSVIIACFAYYIYYLMSRGKPYYFFGGAAILSILVAIIFQQEPTAIIVIQDSLGVLFREEKVNLILIWLRSDGWSCAVSLTLYIIALFVLPEFNSERHLIRKEKRFIERRRTEKVVSFIDYISNVNQLVLGVTGSGKSQFLLKMCEQFIRNTNDMIIFIDGKASIDEQFGVYQTLKLLSRRYHCDFVALNGTSNHSVPFAMPYNPFAGISSPDVIRDMIIALMFPDDIEATAGSEHYRVMFEAYLTQVLQIMLKYNVKITLINIVTLLDKDSLTSFIDDPENNISDTDRERIRKSIIENYIDVSSSITKLNLFIQGEGKHIFSCDNIEYFNMRTAYEKRQIVVVLIDEMSMPTFASGIARLVNMDIRSLVAARLNGTIDCNRYCHIIEDEFSAYPSKSMLSLISRARSANCNVTLATQSVSDIKAISDDVFGKVVDNTRRFVFFAQNGTESAQEVSDLIGTEITVSSTARSSGGILTHEASNTVEREYRISPDEVKSLKPNTGIIFDKSDDTVKMFKNQFVER